MTEKLLTGTLSLNTTKYIVRVRIERPVVQLKNKSIKGKNTTWSILQQSSKIILYRNFPKFSDRQVWANSADPDQTAPRGAV